MGTFVERIGLGRNIEASTGERDVGQEDRAGYSSSAGRIEFPVVFRGYDRAAVDEYVEDVSRLIAELESSRSPDAAVKRALDRVGEETSGILQRAREVEASITARARARAEERLRSAGREARAMREQAEARVRKLDEDTDVLWQERHRLLEDIERLSNRLGRVVTAANRRFPPAEAEGRTEEAEGSPEQPPDVAGPAADGGSQVSERDAHPDPGDTGAFPVSNEDTHAGEGDAASVEEPSPERRASAVGEARAEEASAGVFGPPPVWEDAPGGRDPLREAEGHVRSGRRAPVFGRLLSSPSTDRP